MIASTARPMPPEPRQWRIAGLEIVTDLQGEMPVKSTQRIEYRGSIKIARRRFTAPPQACPRESIPGRLSRIP
ncbi:MAG: hypothetical protein METHAR1v1_470006 [Methanothrix sp.]|nr:MAG: hypothetical protein METHAR1v1_470006 [Methanothrix sp.]